MNTIKKIVAVSATASMVLWSFGTALPVGAVTIADGDLVKTADSSAVYYVQGANKRVFPHANVYFSWGYPSDFSTVKTVTTSELSAYSDANAMVFRDGSLFRGTASSLHSKDATAVFYVENAMLRPVLSEDVYQALFKDASWSKVTWVPDDLLTKFNYDLGSNLSSSSTHPDGSLVRYTGTTQVYVVEGGKKRAVSDAALTANRYDVSDVIDISSGEVYSDGSAVTGAESGLLTPGWSGISVAAALTVSLDSANPAAATIADGATNVSLLKVRFTAGGSVVSVTGLKFKRSDIGGTNEWSDLYIYEGNTRVTAIGRTLNTDHEVEFPALSISIPANSSKVVTLRGDISLANSTAGSRHAFQLIDVTTSATLGSVLLTGNVMTVGSQQVGAATISRATTPSSPSVGASGAEILQFKIQNTSANQDVTFDQVVFTFAGSIARTNITNLKLRLIGESANLATASGIASNDTVTLTLGSPYTILKGLTKTFSLFADLGGKRDETLSLYVDQTNHVVVTDSQYSVGAIITIDGTIDAAADTELTLQGGDVTLADNGPIAGKIGKSQNDVVLTKFSMTSDRDLEVRRLQVTLDNVGATFNNADGDISDLRIKDLDSGATVMSATVEADADGVDKAYTLTNAFNLTAGVTRNFSITVDTGADADNDLNDLYFAANLAMVTYGTNQVYIYDTGTGQYVNASDVVPNTISGDNQQVIASDVSFGLASTPVSDTFVKGATGVEAVGVIVTASEASNLTIKQVQFRAYASSSAIDYLTSDVDPSTVVTAFKLYDGSTLLSSKTATGYTAALNYGTVTFNNLNVTVTKGTNKKFLVKADTNSAITATRYFYLALEGSDSHTTAYDADSNSLTIAATDDVNISTDQTNFDEPTVELTVTTGGTLTMTLDGDTPVADNVVAGALNVPVTKVKFTTTDESFTINKLKVQIGTAAYARALTSVSIAFPGTTKSGTLDSNGAITFRDLSWTISKDASAVLTVSADFNTIVSGAQSGDQVRLDVLCNTAANCEAVGSSSTVLGDAGAELSDIQTGNILYLRKTKPTVTLAANSALGTFVPGWTDVGTFTFAADAADDLELDKIQWTLETNGTTWKADLGAADFRLYDTTNLSDDLSDNTGVTVAYTTSTGVVSISWTNATRPVVSKGASRSYKIEVDTLSSATTAYAIDQGLGATVDAVLRAYIDSDVSGATGAAADLHWDDEINTTYAELNGYLVKNLNPLYGNSRNYDK